jgi:uncharacterized membrane protein
MQLLSGKIFLKMLVISMLSALSVLAVVASVLAQEASPDSQPVPLEVPDDYRPSLEYHLGVITEVMADKVQELAGTRHIVQKLKAKITRGKDKGKDIDLQGYIVTQESQKLKKDDKVVIVKQISLRETVYYVSDKYRLPPFLFIFGIFFVLAIIFARVKGFMAIVGLAVSILILVQFVIPKIITGSNPLLVSLMGAVSIAVLSLYLAHGYNKRTSIALVSTLLTLAIATGLSMLFVSLAKLTGLGSEDAFYLQLGPVEQLNLKGLLLGGIIIGALGVLDDVTTSQVAAVDEIHSANPKLSFRELYTRGLSVGQEHIASLVNTLALAYVGSSLPLFLLFTLNNQMPLWVKLNSELIAEEFVRTLVGSCALIFAVPISTFLAALYFEGREPSRDSTGHYHHH